MFHLGANRYEVLEETVVLFCETNVSSPLIHPDILETKDDDSFVLVKKPDKTVLIGDILLDDPLPCTRYSERFHNGKPLSDTRCNPLEILVPLSGAVLRRCLSLFPQSSGLILIRISIRFSGVDLHPRVFGEEQDQLGAW